MPAFKGKNLRSGDIAEQVGLLLLQSVSLVAPVPRTEDIGIDAVATLITDYNNYNYIAEDSFLVQIKSSSVTEVEFTKGQVKWLCDLQLPLFIASVDRKTSSIKIFSTHSLSNAIVENANRERINFVLTKNYDGDIPGKNSSIDLPIGPHILEWSLESLEKNSDFIKEFYQIMKSHILLVKKAIETRRVGFVELATWNTGSPPSVYGSMIHPIADAKVLDETTAPYFSALLKNMVFEKDFFTMRSLYRLLSDVLEREGHFEDVDGKRELIKWTAPNINNSL